MVSKWVFFFVTIGFCYEVIPLRATDIKTWTADTNFDNSRNWEGGRLPCVNDRVVFPASSSMAIFMPETFSVAEMVLPLNGQLIFPEKAVFSITGGSQAVPCVGQDVNFKTNTDFWFDPDNWNITSERAFPRGSSRRNTAVPHAYQVPCKTDQVHFPPRTAFKVHSISPSPRVTSLHINNLEYTQEDFDSLLNTLTGKLLFPDNPRIQITHAPCADETGCVCGNEEAQTFSTVCKFKSQCPALKCLDPIQVTGHCCPMCASKLLLRYKSSFRMEQLIQLHQNFQDKTTFRQVESFTSKTSNGNIQSVFVDGTNENGIANRLAQLIYNALAADAGGSSGLNGIRSVEIYKSEKWISGSSEYESSFGGMSSGGIAALVILILVVSSLAAVFYIYRKRQIEGFSFARFDLRSDKIELELGTTPHDELEPEDRPAAVSADEKGFDNPVYGAGVTSEAPMPVEASSEERDFVENPMFMIFEDSSKRDES